MIPSIRPFKVAQDHWNRRHESTRHLWKLLKEKKTEYHFFQIVRQANEEGTLQGLILFILFLDHI